MPRKSPIKHKVKTHTREGKKVDSFIRGKGSKNLKFANPNPIKSKKETIKNFIESHKCPLCRSILGFELETKTIYCKKCHFTCDWKDRMKVEGKLIDKFSNVYELKFSVPFKDGWKTVTVKDGKPVVKCSGCHKWCKPNEIARMESNLFIPGSNAYCYYCSSLLDVYNETFREAKKKGLSDSKARELAYKEIASG